MMSGRFRLQLTVLLVCGGVWVTAFCRAQGQTSSSKSAKAPTNGSTSGGSSTTGLAYYTPGFTTTLVSVKEVQQELKLSAEQKAKVDVLYETLTLDSRLPGQEELQELSSEERGRKIAEAMQRRSQLATQLRAQVYAVLNEAQGRRLKELILQRRGPSVLLDDDVCSQLAVTSDQKEKMRIALSNDRSRVLGPTKTDAAAALVMTVQERAKWVEDTRKVTESKMSDALTAEQKEKFEKLRGVKFNFPVSLTITNDGPSAGGSSAWGFSLFSSFPATGTPFNLISRESVQKELQLSEAQKKKSAELSEKLRSGVSFPSREEQLKLSPEEQRKKVDEALLKRSELEKQLQKQLFGLLNVTQAQRLTGLSVQRRGLAALLDDEICTELSLTTKQKETIKTVFPNSTGRSSSSTDEPRPSQKSLSSAEREKQFSDRRKKIEEQSKEAETKVLNALTAVQKEKWEKLKGAPFDFSRPSGRGGSKSSRGKSSGGAKP